MKLIKTLTTKKSSKGLFDDSFANIKEWSDKDNVNNEFSSVIGKAGFHSDSFVKDNKDYTCW